MPGAWHADGAASSVSATIDAAGVAWYGSPMKKINGATLRQLRTSLGLSLTALARLAGCSRHAVGCYEAGSRGSHPSWRLVAGLATALGVTPDRLLDAETETDAPVVVDPDVTDWQRIAVVRELWTLAQSGRWTPLHQVIARYESQAVQRFAGGEK